jgi:hypothetical protein
MPDDAGEVGVPHAADSDAGVADLFCRSGEEPAGRECRGAEPEGAGTGEEAAAVKFWCHIARHLLWEWRR